MGNSWGNGLCNCFDDVGGCLLGCFCPCIVQGQVCAASESGSFLVGCLLSGCCPCHLCQQCYLRDAGKKKAGVGSGLDLCDVLSIWCCFPCALCQDKRAMDAAGFHG
mmetsp:Transcript_31469/g.30810  ORF Transcript_31469/g.30810 Transcript_31469/m.30810 type:complete len:107 (+) Transcript_31469:71-391(+)